VTDSIQGAVSWNNRQVCVVVCCSVLQCVAVGCSGLQCVAVCCSVLQWVAVTHCSCCVNQTLLRGQSHGTIAKSFTSIAAIDGKNYVCMCVCT